MGRFYYDNKKTVEESTELCIFRLNKWGLLKGWHSTNLTWTWRLSGSQSSARLVVDVTGSEPYARLIYTITRYRDGSKQDYDYRIGLVKTPCHLGGVRYWFLCPQCAKQVARLYRKPLGEMYFCRICNDLTYESRNESRLGRFGGICYVLKVDRQIEELKEQMKRDFYAGKPTRKYRKLLKMQNRLHISLGSPTVRRFLHKR